MKSASTASSAFDAFLDEDVMCDSGTKCTNRFLGEIFHFSEVSNVALVAPVQKLRKIKVIFSGLLCIFSMVRSKKLKVRVVRANQKGEIEQHVSTSLSHTTVPFCIYSTQ
jgi:hypothetical protein